MTKKCPQYILVNMFQIYKSRLQKLKLCKGCHHILYDLERNIGDLIQYECYNSNKIESWKITLLVKVVKCDLILSNIDIYYINSYVKTCIKVILKPWLEMEMFKNFRNRI